MMKKLDQRGVAAFEFCFVAAVFFTVVFAVFDLARYAITVQSLRVLANAGARATMIDKCYMDAAIKEVSAPYCAGDPLPSTTDKQAAAPFLFGGGLTPTLTVAGAGPYTITASQPGFTMIMPIWGTALNAPSASTKLPFPGV
jgi:Flp pilus assembly protein TadG